MTSTMVKRAYKYRFYPTAEQEQQLAATFGCTRYVYNRALAERTRAWYQDQQRVTYADTSKMLTAWKRDEGTQWLAEPSKGPLQESLRQLQGAFDRFWRKQTSYPNFKKKGKSKDSATYYSNCFRYRDGQVFLAKQKAPLDIRWSRPLPEGATPSQVTVSVNSRGQYHISILVEEEIVALVGGASSVGVDAGLTTLMTFSTGEKIANPRHERKDRARLAAAQKALSRKQCGSKNRIKAKLVVAKIHGRIADRRQDNLHKLTTRLVRESQVIAIEDLSVRNMVKNHSLARAISDAAWSEFRSQLEYKAGWYGRTVVAVDRFYPSTKTCSACGRINNSITLGARSWVCSCGANHDRDINAAININTAGLAVLACGAGVRPSRT